MPALETESVINSRRASACRFRFDDVGSSLEIATVKGSLLERQGNLASGTGRAQGGGSAPGYDMGYREERGADLCM